MFLQSLYMEPKMDYFASLTEADDTARDSVRSAVVLGKLRFDEQLGPFVRTSKVRLDSSLVQTELNRIIAEVANEASADVEKVGKALRHILADAVAVTEPEKTTLDSDKTFGGPSQSADSVPSGGDAKEESPLPGVERTDVNDSDAVLEDEILEADATIDITKPLDKQSCVRCQKEDAEEDSPVCKVCSDALVALAKKKEALAPNNSAPMQPQQPAAQQPGAPTHLMPLNPNAPYQCTVCGRTGTWDEVNNHLQTALDVPHMTAKQQLQMQDQQGTMQAQQPAAPQQAPAYHGSFREQNELVREAGVLTFDPAEPLDEMTDETVEAIWEKMAGEYEKEHDEDAAVDSEHAQNPSSHFDYVIENMANRAAARHFSTPTDQDISQIATTYGLDPSEIKQSIQGVATFGNYHGSNGTIGPAEAGPPEGYTEVDLNNNGAGIQAHEAVVPMNLAIRKVSEDLNMDPDNVYNSVKSAYGGDLSDEYHTSVQGEFHWYLPQEVMAKATQHPQPPAPDQGQQQGQQPMQAQPNMGMPQPDPSQMPQMGASVLNDEQLEVKLTRDGKLADQRKQALGPPPDSNDALLRMHQFNPTNMNVSDPDSQPSGQACPYCNGPMSIREGHAGLCDNCASVGGGTPSVSPTLEKISPSY